MSPSRSIMACALSLLVVLSCGPNTPPPRGDTPPGAECVESSQCQGGLMCEEGACVFERCNSAPDPDAWCATKLASSTANTIRCERGSGVCVEEFGQAGDACTLDEGCQFGLVCEQKRCTETCVSSASCRMENTSCLPRPHDKTRSVCQPSPDCQTLDDPRQFCALELGLEQGEVECNESSGLCEPIKIWIGRSCRFDMQCQDGVCEEKICTSLCGDDEDCRGDDLCKVRGGEAQVKVCQPRTCLDEPDPRAFCQSELLLAEARCDASGECVGPDTTYGVFILIEDVSSGLDCASSVRDVNEPGTDLMYIQHYGLEDEQGDDLSPAETMVHYVEPGLYEIEHSLVTYEHLEAPISSDHINAETGCLLGLEAPEPGKVYAMGCGGKMVVSFSKQGEPVEITEWSEIYIGEYGPLCYMGDAADNDSFRVWACRDTNAVANAYDLSSCDTEFYVEADGILNVAYIDDF